MVMRIFNPAYKRFRRILYGTFGFFLLLIVGFVVFVGFNLPDFSALENTETDLSTVVFSRDGQVLGNYYARENRIMVKLHQIPQNLKDALIATEDVRFYNHAGIDLVGIFRAFGQIAQGNRQGGSTLTMQLARNLYNEQVGRDRSVTRKIREMIAAAFLERRYTKDEIMMHYLNTVPFGGVRFGVQAAAQYFFGKNSSELEAHESAMLVGLLKGNTKYNPYRNPEAALDRRNTVIDQMEKYGFITPQERDSLQELPLSIQEEAGYSHDEGLAPYFREELRQWLKEWCEENGYNMYTDGLRVYTTIDSRMQNYAEAAVRRHLSEYQAVFDQQMKNYKQWERDTTIVTRARRQSARYNMMLSSGYSKEEILATFEEPRQMTVFDWNAPDFTRDTVMSPMDSLRYYAKFLETGVVTIEPTTGHVLAWVGGVDHRFFKYDHVNKGRRQVGSTFKPFVYTAAFDNGYSPCYKISNQPFTWETEDGKRWSPRNANGTYSGCVRLRKALAHSINIPTARLMKVVGPRTVAEYAYKMGVKSELEIVPSLALGTTDLNVMELTSAYCSFANLGRWVEPIFVTRIEDRNGNVLADFVPNSRRSLSQETAYLMIDMLRAVVNSGTAVGLRYTHKLGPQIDICGKTGTTQNNSDGWFMGFTPRFVTGVWVGHADRNVHFLSTLYGQGAKMALPIWGYYMKAVYDDEELNIQPKKFDEPEELRVETNCFVFERENEETGCDSYTPEHEQYGDFELEGAESDEPEPMEPES